MSEIKKEMSMRSYQVIVEWSIDPFDVSSSAEKNRNNLLDYNAQMKKEVYVMSVEVNPEFFT
jgi:hypothetical protein